MPCKAPLWETTELLQAGQSVKALSLRHGSCRSCKIVEPFKDACPYIMLASQALGRGTAARLLPGPNRGIDKLPVFCKLAIPRRAGSMLRLVPARRRTHEWLPSWALQCCSGDARPPSRCWFWLMSSHGIVKVLSEALSRILSSYGVRLRQNASKSQKIRALMKLPVVQEGLLCCELGCSRQALDRHGR